MFKNGKRNLEQKKRGKNLKYLPYGFTREGCNMLCGVLSTEVAIARSIQIMRAFSALERGESLDRRMAMGALLELVTPQVADVAAKLEARMLEEAAGLKDKIDQMDRRIWALAVFQPKEVVKDLEERLVARIEKHIEGEAAKRSAAQAPNGKAQSVGEGRQVVLSIKVE